MRLGSREWTDALLAEVAASDVATLVRAATFAERLRCQAALATSAEAREELAHGVAEFEAAIEVVGNRIKAACRREVEEMSTGPDTLGDAMEAGKLLAPSIEEADAIDRGAIRSLHGETMSGQDERLLAAYVERANAAA